MTETAHKKKLHRKRADKWHGLNRWYRPYYYAYRRCTDVNHRTYSSYGGRGIKFVLTKDEAKILYKRDNGIELETPSLDREDPDGHYEFSNCRYVEWKENHARRRMPGKGNGEVKDICCADPNAGEWEE